MFLRVKKGVKQRKRFLLIVVVVNIQLLLLYIAHQRHVYRETVKFNKKSLGSGKSPLNAWWRNQNLTIWTVWIGPEEPPPVIAAAMESCKTIHEQEPDLHYRVVTNDDLHSLGFTLHPSFWLLDNVEQSDYLRAELLHYYGGFYMDADMVCLHSFSTLLTNNLEAGAAQDRSKYGAWPSVSQNALGPFRPHSKLSTAWHEELHKTMDDLTPALQECASKYAPDAIPYPTLRKYGTSLCGTTWGAVIDFIKPTWLEFSLQQQLGHEMSMCDVYGKHLGWDDYQLMEKCDVVHLGTAGDFYKKQRWDMHKLCQELPVMKDSIHCS